LHELSPFLPFFFSDLLHWLFFLNAFEDDLLFFDGVLFAYSFEYLLVFLLRSFLLKLQKHQLDDFVEDDKEVADYVHGG